MRKVLVAFLLVAMLSVSLGGAPQVQGSGGTLDCFIGIVKRMGEITTNPGGILMDLFACYGDRTWDYISPFAGGYMGVLANTIWEGLEADGNGDKVLTEVQLYNFIMSMIKQAMGEVLNYPPGSDNFRYRNSTLVPKA